MTTEKSIKMIQAEMHKDFFDRCHYAIESGFYLEAIFMEYAAMEGRLEVLLGLLGAPCNNKLPFEQRKKTQISHRINCFSKSDKHEVLFAKSKLNKSFWKKMKSWTDKRNGFIHGLYKNEIQYKNRLSDKKYAEEGLEICRILYNETNRLKRLKKKSPEMFDNLPVCSSKDCVMKVI